MIQVRMVVGFYLLSPFSSLTICTRSFCRKVKMTSLLVPPASVKGMTYLDRSAFTVNVELPYLLFHDITISTVIPAVKKYFLKISNFKPVQNISDGTMVYLNPTLVKDFEDISENDREQLSGLFDHFGKKKVELTYQNWNPKEILRAILPEHIDIPSSYSIIGHIMHLNLNNEQLPYKTVIGEVYLDHHKNIKTIVNKTDTINTTFRHFSMEVLAGEHDTVATIREHGFTYKFDFAHVYWNPRLATEHLTLVGSMKKEDTLYDVFAGVGPFAIPANRKGLNVLANDLNPESVKWLNTNATLNKVKKNFKTFNMDGRDFLRNIVKPDLLNRRVQNSSGFEHIVMNLPALAVSFLDVFDNWFTEEERMKICCKPPTVHVYCFVKVSKGDDPCNRAKLLLEEKLGHAFSSEELIKLHYVRNVAPSKEMIRVSFLLTDTILKCEEPATKKMKLEKHNNDIAPDIPEQNGEKQRITEKSKDEKCIQSSHRT